MGFIKWLWSEYKKYKITQELTSCKNKSEDVFIQNFANCIEYGFTEGQLFALLNLVASLDSK